MNAMSLPAVQLADLPPEHQVRVEQGNYVNGRGQLMTIRALHEHSQLCANDRVAAEINAQFGGFVIIDHNPLECQCGRCRREAKRARRERRADRRYDR
ncbi:hypothetical protein KKF05_00005 [Patescibacteria group bacterium]|nr:hypothetical protein [Patescibacteria group bacterium]MBU1915890.1 hypothetical protein [Patescibacteria group bacterium]